MTSIYNRGREVRVTVESDTPFVGLATVEGTIENFTADELREVADRMDGIADDIEIEREQRKPVLLGNTEAEKRSDRFAQMNWNTYTEGLGF